MWLLSIVLYFSKLCSGIVHFIHFFVYQLLICLWHINIFLRACQPFCFTLDPKFLCGFLLHRHQTFPHYGNPKYLIEHPTLWTVLPFPHCSSGITLSSLWLLLTDVKARKSSVRVSAFIFTLRMFIWRKIGQVMD